MQEISVVLSNRVELLYSSLRQRLREQGGAFRRRLVVVPSQAVARYLRWEAAREEGISAGIEFVHARQAIFVLKELLFKGCSLKCEPSGLDLAFAIEELLGRVPELNFLNTPDKRSRYADSVAACFQRYGAYASQELRSWSGHWQADIWKDLMGERLCWGEYLRELSKLEPNPCDVEVHLFGLSFIPRQEYRFFKYVAGFVPVSLFALSPCRMYWGDTRSEKESRRLSAFLLKVGKNTLDLEAYLRDCNPLLANYGRLAREFSEMLEEENYQCEELYGVASWALQHSSYSDEWDEELVAYDSREPSVLEAVQTDLLFMRKAKEKCDFSKAGIEVHVAFSKWREIEILHDNLLRLMEEESSIKPSNIIVMAPDIGKYSAVVRAIFNGSSGRLKAEINDTDPESDQEVVAVFKDIISLAKNRFDVLQFIQILDYESFSQRHKFRYDEVQLIKDWLSNVGTRWGIDTNHRRKLLKKELALEVDEVDDHGTWRRALDDLLCSVALPEGTIDFPDAELLGRFSELLWDLCTDLDPIVAEKELALDSWSQILSQLVTKYLPESDATLQLLQTISCLGSLELAQGKTFSFSSVERQMNKLIKTTEFNQEERCAAVRFCSLLPMRGVPAPVIALLGMNEGVFPRYESRKKIDLLHTFKERDFSPSKMDFDRYLFLEALLSARATFLLSLSLEDGPNISPLVTELIDYLDTNYSVNGKPCREGLTVNHPTDAFDARYFSGDQRMRSYSESVYRSACVETLQNEHPFYRQASTPLKDVGDIEIKTLSTTVRNPSKLYLNEKIGIFLPREDGFRASFQESFGVDFLDRGMWRRDFFEKSLQEIMEEASVGGRLPNSLFRELVEREITDDFEEILSSAKQWGIVKEVVYHIEFSSTVRVAEQVSKQQWILPSPLIGGVRISGTLSNCTLQGLIDYRRGEFPDLVKALVPFLMHCLVEEMGGPKVERRLLMLRSGKQYDLDYLNPFESLSKLIHHYKEVSNSFCPLEPEMIAPLLQEQDSFLTKSVKDVLSSQEALFVSQRTQQATMGDLLLPWRGHVEEVFGELLRCWGKK